MTDDRSVRNQRLLSVAAIALFVAYFLIRYLDWSSLEVGTVELMGNRGFLLKPSHTLGYAATEWTVLGDLALLYALLLIIPNLVYIFRARVTDLLVPALANTGVGALLSAATIYFILSPARAMCCLPHTTGITFQWKLESAAWPALVLALAILGVGLAQGYLRKNAQQQVQSPVISDGPP